MASKNISFDQIPSSIRKPGKYFEFNTKLAVRTLPNNKQRMLIAGQRLKTFVEPARFQGGTKNDCTSGGAYTGSAKKEFRVKISTAGATDQFQYSTDGGKTWATATNITGTAQTLSDGVTVTFAATTGHAVGDEWHFSAWPEPTVAALTPTQVFSDVEAAEKFGYGSIIHLMAKAAMNANLYLDLSICALNDADTGVVSAGAVTISGTSTTSGSLKVYIGNKKVEIGITSGSAASAIAISLQNEMAKYPDLPVTAAVDGTTAGKVNIKAKNKGTMGDQIDISYELTASGVTATITAMTGGATDPNVNDAMAKVFSEHYHIIATPYNDQTSLTTLRTHLDNVSGPMEQRGAVGVYGYDGALASATTLAAAINHGRTLGAYLRGTRSISYEIASAMAAVMAFEEDPAMPLNTLELKNIHAPAIDQRLSRIEQESCLYNGDTPLEVGPGEKVQIVRAISTYIKDAQGIEDISLLDITTIRILDYVRKACRERISLRFPREKLSSKTPPKVRTEILDVLYKLEELEIVENVSANQDGVIVERDLQDPNRLNAKIPVDVVNGLHVFAGRIDLLL